MKRAHEKYCCLLSNPLLLLLPPNNEIDSSEISASSKYVALLKGRSTSQRIEEIFKVICLHSEALSAIRDLE
jgi:hypothetical protein